MNDNERHAVEHLRALRGEIHGLLDQLDTLATDNERLRAAGNKLADAAHGWHALDSEVIAWRAAIGEDTE